MGEFRSGQYLTFRLGRQEFALETARVAAILPAHELISAEDPTEDIAGEARLRGQSFPVLNLRRKLNLPHGISGRTPCIIVVDHGLLTGFMADSVSEVIHARLHDFRAGKLRVGRPRQVLDLALLDQPVSP